MSSNISELYNRALQLLAIYWQASNKPFKFLFFLLLLISCKYTRAERNLPGET